MRIESVNNNSPEFKGIYNNKAALKGLEAISEHGTSFVAGVTLASSLFLRPLAINSTPGVKNENKEYASANSITSGITKFLITEAVAIPIENAVKKIDKNPEQFLKKETIENFKNGAKDITSSRDYKFATQILKSGAGLITAIPKSFITIALIPVVVDLISKNKKDKKKEENKKFVQRKYDPVFEPVTKRNVNFKGSSKDFVAKGIGSVLNNKRVQNTVQKFSKNDENIARNISVATDLLLTTTFALRTKESKKIKEEQKNPLIYNNLISTGITLTAGCAIDKIIKTGGEKFIEKFSKINKNDPKLAKYIEGINILRPTVIFALLYYGILPVFSTYMADKTDKFTKKDDN